MFFKSDQTNVSDARDAVKRQLLRSLIQQVVDDLNESSSEGIDADVAHILAEESFQPVIEELRPSVAKGIQGHLYSSLVSEVVAEMAPSEQDVEKYVESAIDGADLTAMREQVRSRTMERLSSEIIPAIVREESEGIADFKPSDEDVNPLVEDALTGFDLPDLREQVRAQLIGRLKSDVIPAMIKEQSEEVADFSPSKEDVEAMVDTALAGFELSDVRDELRNRINKRVKTSIIPEMVQEQSDEIAAFTPSEEDVEMMVENALAGFDLPEVRDELRDRINKRVKTSIIPEMVQQQSDEIADFTPSEEDIEELVGQAVGGFDLNALKDLVRTQLHLRVTSDIIPAVVKEEADAMDASDMSEHAQRVQDAVTSIQADEMIGRLRAMTGDAMNARLQGEMDQEVSAIRETLDRIKEEFVSERMEQYLFSADWAAAIQEMEADITSRVVSAVEEAVANDSVFGERVSEAVEARVEEDNELRERLKATAITRLVSMMSDHIVADLPGNEAMTNEVVTSVTEHEEVMNGLIDRVAERIHEHLASESVAVLSNAERSADAAFLHVDTDHDHLTGAVDALEKQLVKDISGRAVARLGDAQAVQAKAMAWIPDDHALVTAAVEQILQHVTGEVRKRALKEASDTDTVVGNVLPSFTAETEEVRAAVRETRNRLVERIVTLTLHDMEDAKQVAAEANKRVANENERILDAVAKTLGLLTDRVAEGSIERLAAAEEVAPEAASRVPVDNEVFQRAIKATMSLLIDDIVIEVGSRMRSAEKVSTDARKRMADEPAEVRQAAGVLENMLLQQVAEMTKERLYDVQHASEKASTFLRATKEIDAIEEAMRIKLFKGMADQVVSSIENPEKSGAEAFWHIDQQHEHILDAMSELRNQLLFSIAKGTMDSIADTDKAAEESRALIPATSRQMTDAAAKLQEKLTAEVAREAVNLMRDTESVVEQAGAKLSDHQEALDGMRRIIERHLMEHLLASALTDIGSNVNGMDESAERTFFRSAVRDIQMSRTASETEAQTETREAGIELAVTPEAPVPVNGRDEHIEEVSSEGTDISEDSTDAEAFIESDEELEDAATKPNEEWTSIDELSESTSDAPAGRSWRVNEFRPDDRQAIPGAVSTNGVRTRMPKFPKPKSSRSALYVFGVVRTDNASAEDFEGISGISDDTSVRLLSCGALTALVSATPDPKFSPDAIKTSMADSDWLKEQVRRHADVLAEAQSVQTIIPLRFGCVMPNPSKVKKFIDAREESLMDALTRLHNRSEFSVRVHFEDVSTDDELSGVPSGVADFLRKAASDVEHAPNADGIADRIHSHLSRFSGEAMRNPVLDSDMILNATYLITMASEEEFRAEVRKLSSEFHALGIQIEVSGPWPPYHFVDIDFGGDMAAEL